ncbi:DUF2764 family protein [Phocaeicola coprocola]|uniref:DUF2764 family protein n=1 Tax=Phocaeicola coprocola TaxID=310298 RepID=UPI001C37EA89|nr:DUF2764 family protein [Phocaeicola coprocola]MBV3868458.1 DUF2764 domain-containing protein [Phocaeicola coprocola]MBV4009603.1 DUF2764 domain-containing protein [Phocaeicola coprocola]MBV4034087.1 DUF2764 domain-containing protein [Phocaeicola coprocola]MBV4040674.1 DUF2764 domain-containing protein [Phocaeicola coprocola]MBV4062268.1 DUF2764 domain-containing protein [Phocaeicola coprocola]
MSTYYCLVAGLPDISLDDGKLNYSVSDFKAELYPDLSAQDRKLIDLFYLKFDNTAILKLLKNKDAVIEDKGNFSAEELLQLIEAVREGDTPDKKYPSYLVNFVSQYLQLSQDELYRADDLLAALYYSYGMSSNNAFIASWFEFNLNLNNILAALAARKYKMEVSSVIVGATSICEQLRTSNARDFGLNETLEYFEALQRIADIEELVEREKKVDMLKWKWLEDESFFHYFTIERIFVFLMQLEMIERWISLDKEKGNELFRKMIQDLKNEVQIPEEFRK